MLFDFLGVVYIAYREKSMHIINVLKIIKLDSINFIIPSSLNISDFELKVINFINKSINARELHKTEDIFKRYIVVKKFDI